MYENKTIIAPALESRAAYSNFWCGMTSQVSVCVYKLSSKALSAVNQPFSCRVTISALLPTYPWGNRWRRAALLFQWSIPHSWLTSERRHPGGWPFTHHTQNTAGLLMTSLCLLTLLGWQVWYSPVLGSSICDLHLDLQFHLLLFTDVQMFVCNRETYGFFPVPLRSHNSLQDEADSFTHTLLEVNGECFAFKHDFATESLCFCLA